MKVLMIGGKKLGQGGTESYLMGLLRNFNHDQIKVDFVVHSQEKGCYEDEVSTYGSTVYKLPRLRKRPITYLVTLFRLIKKNKYDIVHIHASASVIWIELAVAKLAGCKTRISHSHNSNWDSVAIHKLGVPLVNIFSTHKLACSDLAGKWMYGKTSFKIAKNGIDVNRFAYSEHDRTEYRKKFNLDNKIAILMVARLTPEKNHLWILDVIKEIVSINKDYMFVFAGDGILAKEIEEKVNKLFLNDNVLLLGGRTDIPQLLSMSDKLMLPSEFEGFPIVLVEGQCSGIDCIASSKITEEVNLGLVSRIDLDKDKWVEGLMMPSSGKDRKEGYDLVCSNNYSQKQTAKVMEDFYLECIQ